MNPNTRLATAFALTTSLLVVCAGPLFAMDYYVDGTNGDDSNSGLSRDDAWKTITHALEVVAPNDASPGTIHVAPGTYAASTNGETFPLTLRSYIRLIGSGAVATVLDAEWEHGLVYCHMTYGVSIKDLSMRHGNSKRIISCAGTSLSLRGCHISNNRGTNTICAYSSHGASSSVSIHSCEFKDNVNDGYCLTGGISRIRSCVLAGNSGRAILHCSPSIANTLVENNDGTVLVTGGGTIENCIFRGNRGGYIFDLQGANIEIQRSIIEDNYASCSIFNLYSSYYMVSSWISTLLLDNTLLAGNIAGDHILIETIDNLVVRRSTQVQSLLEGEEHDERVVLRGCTIADNSGGAPAGYAYENPDAHPDPETGIWQRLRIQDCILSGNSLALQMNRTTLSGSSGGDWHRWPCDVDHSCLELQILEGEGNFVADPMFMSGPLGDYYLSCIDAEQDADSPCIDAGSKSALIAGVSNLTTRTDGAFDAGTVDIGYHYSATPPTIQCIVSAGSEPMHPGDALTASISIESLGLREWVDIYAGFILLDGTIYCISPDGLTTEFTPWLETVFLLTNYVSADVVVFEGVVPGGLPDGTYTFAAALSLTGSFRPIGDVAFAEFQVQSSRFKVQDSRLRRDREGE